MKIAYCRDCKVVIAAGNINPQQVIVVRGQRRVLNTMPYHTVSGKQHRDVGIMEVADKAISDPEKLLKELTRENKSKFD